jgi:hypothetical protein
MKCEDGIPAAASKQRDLVRKKQNVWSKEKKPSTLEVLT